MANASTNGRCGGRTLRARCAGRALRVDLARRVAVIAEYVAVLATLTGCAQVLGIPADPELVPPPSPSQALSTAPLETDGGAPASSEMPDGLPSGEFVDALAAAAPQHFLADPESPGFVFHSIVGLGQKNSALDLYAPDEPIESDLCSGEGSDPDEAGEVYQELSRSTRGLRQSICPANAMNLRLHVLAVDITLRSFAACP